jgi:hypothetical protein
MNRKIGKLLVSLVCVFTLCFGVIRSSTVVKAATGPCLYYGTHQMYMKSQGKVTQTGNNLTLLEGTAYKCNCGEWIVVEGQTFGGPVGYYCVLSDSTVVGKSGATTYFSTTWENLHHTESSVVPGINLRN